MSRIGTLMICAATLALGLGCDDGRSGEDGGGIVLMDNGPDTTPDTGTPPPPTDSGPGDSCPPMEAPAPSPAPVCAASTLSCLMGAMTAEDQQACIDADPMPMECDACILQDLIFTCSNPMGGGCDDQWGEVQCCLADECGSTPAGPEREACLNAAIGDMATPGPCAGDFSTFAMCANSAAMAGRCGITQACFMMSGGFNPDFRPFRPIPHQYWMEAGALFQSLPSVR